MTVRRDRHRRRPQRPDARGLSRARGPASVLVLERRHVLGGAAVTEEVFPGFQLLGLLVRRVAPPARDHPRARPAPPRPRDPAARRHVHADAERRLPVARQRPRPKTRREIARHSRARRRGVRRVRPGDGRRWRGSSSRSSTCRRRIRCRCDPRDLRELLFARAGASEPRRRRTATTWSSS